MNTINTGKQFINLDWYQGSSKDQLIAAKVSKPDYNAAPTLQSQVNLTGEDLIPSLLKKAVELSKHESLPSSSLPPLPADSIPLTQHEAAPVLEEEYAISQRALQPDIIQPLNEFPEPSRIWKDIKLTSPDFQHAEKRNIKKAHRISSVQTPEALPHKKQRLEDTENLNPSELLFFGNYESDDKLDLSYAKRDSSLGELEEQERQYRIGKGIDLILRGKIYKLQKEFMDYTSRSNIKQEQPKEATIVQTSLFNVSKLRNGGEKMEELSFSWPRSVPKEIYEAEDLARSERSAGADPLLSAKMSHVHTELLKKFSSQGWNFSSLRSSMTRVMGSTTRKAEPAAKKALISTISAASSVIGGAFGVIDGVVDGVIGVTEALGKATLGATVGAVEKSAELLGDALDYSSDAIENAKYSLHIRERSSYVITRRLEEEERSRRMSESYTVDPMMESRKMRVARELLSRGTK